MIRFGAATIAALVGLLLAVAPASAHPHVWVTMTVEVVYAPDGSAIGVQHKWRFDDMFSAFATQGLEQKQKGVFTRQELQPLAEVNVTSLKEYDFFTFAKADGKKAPFAEPSKGYYLDYTHQILTLHFLLPFKTPVKAKRLELQIFDPSYFVDFEFEGKVKIPATLVGAPADCALTVAKPPQMDAQLAQKLSTLPPEVRDPVPEISLYTNRISIRCP
jgi:ABC-type uncharacterized transport system substrate-binding protein